MRILVAMSGGVDSGVAAKLLCDGGNECVGCTMKLYGNEDAGVPRTRSCCSLDDVADARSVAYKLGMDYFVFNFSEDFREKVIDKFVDSYLRGVTPNPCIDCNRYMKFDKLFDRAAILGCDYVATGHYARIERCDGKYLLKKAVDPSKDQSYVLYSMTQTQLAHTLFPLGELYKSETRRIAEENGFVNAAKPDSQDICFVPDGDYARVIELHLKNGKKCKPGNFIDSTGNVLGRHAGIFRYTVGQHRGLGVELPGKRYVCRILPEENAVVLGGEDELYGTEAFAEEVNWISGDIPSGPLRCKVMLRYRRKEQWAEVKPEGDGALIRFDEPQRAITPGQAAVFYDEETVLGGGVIAAGRRETGR